MTLSTRKILRKLSQIIDLEDNDNLLEEYQSDENEYKQQEMRNTALELLSDDGPIFHYESAPIKITIFRFPAHISFCNLMFDMLIYKNDRAQIFKGTWQEKPVAIKKYYTHSNHSNSCAKEIATLKSLQYIASPNIITYFGCYNNRFLIMEYIQGQDGLDYINTNYGARNASWKFNLLYETATAIQSFHKYKIVHGDLKWDNLLVSKNTKIKIIDFEFSISLGSAKYKHLKYCAGTDGYCAPEVLKSRQYSLASDVYAFGTMVYMLFEGDTPDNISPKIVRGYRPTISDRTPKGVAELITWCWKQNPEDRPSMQVVHEKVQNLFSDRKKLQA